jgi:hypothetical protein
MTTIPSATGKAHEGARPGRPCIWTEQTKHEAAGGKFSTWQSVGILIAKRRAASRIVVPSSTEIVLPSIVNVTIVQVSCKQKLPCRQETRIAFSGQAETHMPQRVHLSSRISWRSYGRDDMAWTGHA